MKMTSMSDHNQEVPDGFEESDFELVADLTTEQVEEFLAGCSPEEVCALRVATEYGPKVHGSLIAPHVSGLGVFNKSINEYTRTFLGNEDIYLFAYDHWLSHVDEVGYYALSGPTHVTLRARFGSPARESGARCE